MQRDYFCRQEFMKTGKYLSFGEKVRAILARLFDVLNQEGVDFVIKVGRGKNEIITLAYDEKATSNIAAIYIHKEHIRIRLSENDEAKVADTGEINKEAVIVLDILDKYFEQKREKRRFSIYVYSDIIEKLEVMAQAENKKVNEIIEQSLEDRTKGLFNSRRHKVEFIDMLKQAGYTENISSFDKKTMSRVAAIYLVSAYQKEYLRNEGEKFSIICKGEKTAFGGPVHLIRDLDIGYDDSHVILAFAILILSPTMNSESLIDIMQSMNESTFPLAVNAMKILKGQYMIDTNSEEILTRMQVVEI
ncbi:MAG TPA: hypothetical protein PLP03_09095 [Bacteroidales bacterium]|jgi:ATPase subunit of ABC transporter with duplicated ATPase domains|nr:hypothetical protein [Bacteroidales bacterium]